MSNTCPGRAAHDERAAQRVEAIFLQGLTMRSVPDHILRRDKQALWDYLVPIVGVPEARSQFQQMGLLPTH